MGAEAPSGPMAPPGPDPLAGALSQALAGFRAQPPADMALAGGGRFLPRDAGGGVVRLSYCGQEVDVSWPDGGVAPASLLSRAEHILVLQYLAARGAVPPRGSWLAFLDLPGGSHHLQPFLAGAVEPLARAFGRRPGRLVEAGRRLGGRGLAVGSAAVEVPALPRVPIAAVVWAEDPEFAARAGVLFDVTAPLHLTTASLYVLGIEVSRRLVEAG
ncbi:MAG: DUF3786 domain-containing protein [Acetobacteraceae bacterium]|nr:DUF3786 domain-containing protein [Acetobacteraceae bacterium]